MKSQREIIVLVEIGRSHDECLLTQMEAIKEGGFSCVLVCTDDVKERNPAFYQWVDEFLVISDLKGERLKEVRHVWRHIKSLNPKCVVLNTAQGSMVRNLCLFALFSKIEFVGIIHTLLKTQGSFTQKVISWKVKKYAVLSEYLLGKITPKKGIKYDYFYPIVFPEKMKAQEHEGINVTVIGGVEKRRKDLEGFIEMIKKEGNGHYYFLGKSDADNSDVKAFKEQIREAGLEKRITLFNSFVSHKEFSEILSKTDFILPLIHPETPSADQYFKNQITGAMTVSFGYKVPMLIQQSYGQIEEMKTASFYYNQDTYGDSFEGFVKQREEKIMSMQDAEVYTEQYQKKRYLHFLLY